MTETTEALPEGVAHAEPFETATPHGTIRGRRFVSASERPCTPLVILHGGPGASSDYLAPLAALADARDVILYDQIGCGGSDQPSDESAWSVDSYVTHLQLVLDRLGIDRAVLLGHSWGGMLALAAQAAHPDTVAALILASPLVDVADWVADANALIEELPEPHRSALLAGEADPGYSAGEAEFYRRHFCKLDPWPAILERSMADMDQASYNAMWGPNEFTQTGNLRGASYASRIRDIAIPILWITGADDEARPETLRRYAATGTSSTVENTVENTVEVLAGGTHNVHLEQPEAYLAALRRFLTTL